MKSANTLWSCGVVAALLIGCSPAPMTSPVPPAGPDASSEGGPPVTPITLPVAELARRLSRFVWAEDADAPLLATVLGAPPRTTADVEALARQMLTDRRAHTGVGAFYGWWMRADLIAGLKKDATLFPEDSPTLRQAMADEPRAFGAYVTLDGDHSYRTLMTAPVSFVNAALADVYKIPGVTGQALQMVALDRQQRAGILTQPGWLAIGASDISPSASARGYFMLRRMLCAVFPTPPPDESSGDPPAGTTNRQWIEVAAGSAGCRPCHASLDPLGFGLGQFDALGRFSTTEHGVLVDPSGQLQDTRFADQRELAALLATRRQPQDCFAQQWLRFALGRELTAADQNSLTAVQARFAASAQDIPSLIAAVAGSDAFLAP
ncbi:MAG TPA: DUF1592 domain-containing protein [Polyangia bacterium]|nr:DUF1592 domain-containing protein [Polyangia bacterium]